MVSFVGLFVLACPRDLNPTTPTVVLSRHLLVVSTAEQSQILGSTVASEPVRVPVVILEPHPLGAPSTLRVPVTALPIVTLGDGALHGGRDVARARGRVARRDLAPGILDSAE